MIGSARCLAFRERAGRLIGAKHLIEKNICNIVCSGGDGSLTGANLFRLEWPSLVEELLSKGRWGCVCLASLFLCVSLSLISKTQCRPHISLSL